MYKAKPRQVKKSHHQAACLDSFPVTNANLYKLHTRDNLKHSVYIQNYDSNSLLIGVK